MLVSPKGRIIMRAKAVIVNDGHNGAAVGHPLRVDSQGIFLAPMSCMAILRTAVKKNPVSRKLQAAVCRS
jgi:hypothetical protein